MLELAALVMTIGAILYRVGEYSLYTIGYVGLVLAVVCMIVLRSRQGIVVGLLAGCVLCLGALAVWRADEPLSDKIFGNRAFDARVVSVDRRLERTNIVVVDTEYDQKLQLVIRGLTSVLPGDNLTVRGAVVQPQDFATDTGRIFGYRAYLASKGIVGIVQDPILGPVTSRTVSIARIPTIIRYKVADLFARHIAFPVDAIVAGMLVGYQGGLPQSTQDLFRDTGVLHVLVLSGYNITLLAGFLAILLKGLPFRIRTMVTIAAIIVLVLVSGAGVASVRAGIMGGIAVFAGLSIRTYRAVRALTIAYLVFFFASPTSIFVDPGFHLSFLATLFMICVLPKVEPLFYWIPKTTHINVREMCILATAVPLFMLPYLMYFSGVFPFASPIANIVFAFATPLLMSGGIILIATAWISPVAHFMGMLIGGIGRGVVWFLEQCQRMYLWHTPELPWWIAALVYSVVLGYIFRAELSAYLLQLQKALRRQSSS